MVVIGDQPDKSGEDDLVRAERFANAVRQWWQSQQFSAGVQSIAGEPKMGFIAGVGQRWTRMTVTILREFYPARGWKPQSRLRT